MRSSILLVVATPSEAVARVVAASVAGVLAGSVAGILARSVGSIVTASLGGIVTASGSGCSPVVVGLIDAALDVLATPCLLPSRGLDVLERCHLRGLAFAPLIV